MIAVRSFVAIFGPIAADDIVTLFVLQRGYLFVAFYTFENKEPSTKT